MPCTPQYPEDAFIKECVSNGIGDAFGKEDREK